MAFRKFASVRSVGVGTFDSTNNGLKKVASGSADGEATPQPVSYYMDGARKIDVRAALERNAKRYDISADPTDYIFEAIRANSTNVPNENHDAFHKSELLRFDTRLAKPVYMTYVEKPHHLDHKADDPKRARGIILDAHYNDETPALETCPTCASKTAALEARDPTGIHCAKCGSVVKDEFVEILVAVDTRKDPGLARGIQAGILNAGSMGCFLPGTPITLADGTRIPIEDVRPGDQVITHTGAIAEVGETSVHEHEDAVFRIFVQGHQEPVVATGNHPFWVVDPETGEGSWVDAEALKPGQYLRCPTTKQETVEVENDFARLVGYFLSEGNYIKAYDGPHRGKRVGLEFSFALGEETYVEEVVRLLRKYGNDPSVYERPSRNLKVVKDYRCIGLVERMFELVGQHAVDKTLSSEVLAWPREAQLHLIGTWLNGDGYSIHDSKHSWSGITTASVNLRDQLSQMLVNLGIPHRHRYQPSSFGGRVASEVIISGNPQLDLVGYSDKIKRPHGVVGKVATLADENGLLRKIKAVEAESYEGPVYNFEVKHEDHSYVAGGVAVHNCNCASTVCNVCSHVAHSVHEFCEHIRGGNKGSLWQREGSKFKKITAEDVRRLLKEAGYAPQAHRTEEGNEFKLVAVSLVAPDLEIRRAFENCLGVEFDEYSRVHRPADPKAKSIEILKAAGAENGNSLSLSQETELLILRARLAQMESRVSKAASVNGGASAKIACAVRVNGNSKDIHIAATLNEALKKAALGKRDRAEIALIAADESTETVLHTAQWLPLESDVQLVIPDGVQVQLDEFGNPSGPGGLPPGSEVTQPGGPRSIEDLTQQEVQGPEDIQQSPEEFGMLPPGASLDSHAEAPMPRKEMKMPKSKIYASVYGDFEVEVFEDRAVVRSPGVREVFTAKAKEPLNTKPKMRAFGRSLIESLETEGLVRTAKKYEASISKTASDGVLEGAVFDLAENRAPGGGGVLEGSMSNLADKKPSGKPGSVLDNPDDVLKDPLPAMPKSTLESRDTDLADEAETQRPGRVTDDADDDLKENRMQYSQKSDVLEGAQFDLKASQDKKPADKPEEKQDKTASKETEKAAAVEARLKKLYASRVEKLKAEFEEEQKAREASMVERFGRALKIAAKRQLLNVEISPLKATMVDSLTVPRTVGKNASTNEAINFSGMDEDLALHLVEAAWAQSGQEEIEALVARAAELMSYDDKYLVSAEKDLSKQAVVIPQVIASEQVTPLDEYEVRSQTLRTAAMKGNLTLAPSETEGTGMDRATRIRAALGGSTRIGQLLESVGGNSNSQDNSWS